MNYLFLTFIATVFIGVPAFADPNNVIPPSSQTESMHQGDQQCLTDCEKNFSDVALVGSICDDAPDYPECEKTVDTSGVDRGQQ